MAKKELIPCSTFCEQWVSPCRKVGTAPFLRCFFPLINWEQKWSEHIVEYFDGVQSSLSANFIHSVRSLVFGNVKKVTFHSKKCSENETLSKCSLCYLLIYFRKNVTGQCIFSYHGVSCPLGEHLADFRPGNSKVPINSVFFLNLKSNFSKNF